MIPVEKFVLDEELFPFPRGGIGDCLVVREPGSTLSEVDSLDILVTVAGGGAVMWKPVPGFIDFPNGVGPIKTVEPRPLLGVDSFRVKVPQIGMRWIENHQGRPQLSMVLRLLHPVHLDGFYGFELVFHHGHRALGIHEIDHLLDVVKKQEVAIREDHRIRDAIAAGDVGYEEARKREVRRERSPVNFVNHLVVFDAVFAPIHSRSPEGIQLQGGDDAGDATVPLGAMCGYLVGDVFPRVVSNEDMQHAPSIGGAS